MKKTHIIYLLIITFLLQFSIFSAVLHHPVVDKPNQMTTQFLFTPLNLKLNSHHFEIQPVPFENKMLSKLTHNSILSAAYERITVGKANQIMKKYKEIPGGITLEGKANGLPFIKKVTYDVDSGSFIINDQIEYQVSLSPHEIKHIFESIYSNDLLGVSLGDHDVTYGNMTKGSIPDVYLKMADHLLGSMTFANNSWIKDSHHTSLKYNPIKDKKSAFYAVYFNFNDFNFETHNNELKCEHAHLNVNLIPLNYQKDQKGHYTPDFNKIENQDFSKAYEQNIQHIIDHINYYENDTRIQKAVLYGQIASFARALLYQNISLTAIF